MDLSANTDILLYTLCFLAIVSGIACVAQAIVILTRKDSPAMPFRLLSLRNLAGFTAGFSFTALSFYHAMSNTLALICLSLGTGILFMYMFFVLVQQVQKLVKKRAFRITDILGQTAEVYIPIPEKRSGKGGIMISVNGYIHELPAMTEQTGIEAGTIVRITKVNDRNMLIVEKA
jgi:membrane protein implicated in regulation of membrane protease activity